jgi:hypothetical protein
MSAITSELKALPVEFKRRGEELLIIFGLSPDLLNPPQLAPYYSSETGFHPAEAGLSRQDTLQLPNLDYYLAGRVIKHLEAYQSLGDQLPVESDLYDEHLDDLVIRHKGISVYRTYRWNGPASDYWFALYGGAESDDSDTFDIRDFYTPPGLDRNDDKAVLRYAIDSEQLDEDGVVPEDEEDDDADEEEEEE